MVSWPRVIETELKRAPLVRPRAFSCSEQLPEGKLALQLVPGRTSFSQGVGWSPYNDRTESCPARKKGFLLRWIFSS